MFLASGHSPSLASSKFSSTFYIIISSPRLPSPASHGFMVFGVISQHQIPPHFSSSSASSQSLARNNDLMHVGLMFLHVTDMSGTNCAFHVLPAPWQVRAHHCEDQHTSHLQTPSPSYYLESTHLIFKRELRLQIRLQFRLGITKINQDVVINNCDVLLSRDPAQHPMLSIESRSTSSKPPSQLSSRTFQNLQSYCVLRISKIHWSTT